MSEISKPRVLRATPLWQRVLEYMAILAATILAAVVVPAALGSLGAPAWTTWAILVLAAAFAYQQSRHVGLSWRTVWLIKNGIPTRTAIQITANWGVHCEDAGAYGVKRRGDLIIHRYPTLGDFTLTPSGVYVRVGMPTASFTPADLEALAPNLSTAFGVPVAVYTDPLEPAIAEVHFRVRDPLEGTRKVGEIDVARSL